MEIKYTRNSGKPIRYKCANPKCKWHGLDNEKSSTLNGKPFILKTCPKCSGTYFYKI